MFLFHFVCLSFNFWLNFIYIYFQFVVLFLLQIICFYGCVICYPAEISDTPITKIDIHPTKPTSATSDAASENTKRGRTIENVTSIAKALKKPTEKPSSTTHPKKYDAEIHTNSTEPDPVHITRAKVNGSFQQILNSTRDAKQWRVYKLKPAKRIHLVTLKPTK